MLRLLLPCLLAASGVLAYPARSWSGQLVSQTTDDSSFRKHDASDTTSFWKHEQSISNSWGHQAAASSKSMVKLIYQFTDQTKLENLAARSNGQILLTPVSDPIVYSIDPTQSHPKPRVVHKFPNCTGMTGIVEAAPDVFVVIAGNWSTATFKSTPGSFTVWSIDFNGKGSDPAVKVINAIPEAAALNGLTNMPGTDFVLISDSGPGLVWKLNFVTGEYSKAIESPLFTNNSYFPLGINGIASYDDKLHFINSAQGIYGRVTLNDDLTAAGEVEIIARAGPDVIAFDDLAIDWEGNGWIATHGYCLTEITQGGKARNVTADSKDGNMVQPASVTFGKGSIEQEKTAYICTSGDDKTAGQLWSVDTCQL